MPSMTKFAALRINDIIRSQPSSPALSQTTQTCSAYDSEYSPTTDLLQLIPAGASKGMSTHGLVRQISRKFSTIFGNGNPTTIVHKPNLRARPSFQSIQDKFRLPTLDGEQGLTLGNSTNPSSFNDSGSISPADHSTGKTSLDSNVASQFSLRNQQDRCSLRKSLVFGSKTCERPLPPIEEVPAPVTPTVLTVESTANAKIFFETHFNTLLSSQVSPRSQRRHDLESYLQTVALSPEQRQEELTAWASTETAYLRRSRILKSKTNEMSGSAGIAIAGYEVVRILGKGSFGVVRLVRAKDTEEKLVHSTSSSSSFYQNRGQSPGEESSNLTITSVEPWKSSNDGQARAQRRDLRKAKKEVFAMKVIRKSDMLRNSQEGHLRAERDFLVASEKSQWVVPLIASFQDTTNLYLVMEYMVGGDFLGLLFRKDTLKPRNARWYIAEMILCVEEAHRLRWIHRDVKPDNFLISASGHLKISDFGLAFDGHWAHDQKYFNDHRHSLMDSLGIIVDGDSIDRQEGRKISAGMSLANRFAGAKDCDKKPQFDGPADKEGILEWRNRVGTRKLARSMVGTSQYMAPEVIRGDFYDGRCDWWSIGIILFEVAGSIAPLPQTCADGHFLVSVWLHSFCL